MNYQYNGEDYTMGNGNHPPQRPDFSVQIPMGQATLSQGLDLHPQQYQPYMMNQQYAPNAYYAYPPQQPLPQHSLPTHLNPQLLQQHAPPPPVEMARPPPQPQQPRAQVRPPPPPQQQPQQLPPTPVSAQQAPAPPTLNPPPGLDYSLLLISLAESYLNSAYTLSPLVALGRRTTDAREMYKLIATGLACLESVLLNFRLAPRLEARVRLKYATILDAETENLVEAETCLSKGISLCERNRLLDLKYTMQHLLVRIMSRNGLRAAVKQLDNIVGGVVT